MSSMYSHVVELLVRRRFFEDPPWCAIDAGSEPDPADPHESDVPSVVRNCPFFPDWLGNDADAALSHLNEDPFVMRTLSTCPVWLGICAPMMIPPPTPEMVFDIGLLPLSSEFSHL